MNGKWNYGVALAGVITAMVALVAPGVLPADAIRIGAILPITGNSAANGPSERDGLQLAIDEINKRGGVNGSRIEFYVEDSKSDPQAAVDAFNRLEASRQPLLYVSFLSSVGTALAPLADEKHVVLVGLVTTALDFTRGREWVFRYWPLGQAYTAPIMRMLQDLKVKRLGIIYQNDAYGVEQQQLMVQSFSGAGGTVVTRSVEMNDTDFRTQIAALKNQEAIYVACTGNIHLSVIRQLREAKYGGSILSSNAADPALFNLPEMDGVYAVVPIIHNPNYLYAREAGEQFTAQFKKPFDQWAASGYDFIRLIAGFLEDRQATRQSVRDLLSGGFRYSGVFGEVRLRAGEHDITFPMYPAQITGGTLKYR